MQIRIGEKRKRRRWLRWLITFAIFIFIPLAVAWLVNLDFVLNNVLRTVNFKSPTQIALADFYWNPLSSKIKLTGLGIHHEPNGRDGWVDKIEISYSPLGFLRGKFIIDKLDIDGVDVVLPPTPKELKQTKKKRKRLNITRLLLLHSLAIERATIRNFTVAFAKDATFRSDEINWSLRPRFTGDTTLAVNGNNITLHKGVKKLLSISNISLKTSTLLAKWHMDFPYLNAMEGAVTAGDIDFQNLPIDKLEARMRYQNSLIELQHLQMKIGGNELIGVMSANVADQKINLNIDIPKPIHLPHLGKPIKTLDTAGDLSGHIEFSGTGFIPKDINGSGHVALTHHFRMSPDYPVQITSNFSWRKGIINVSDSQVETGASTLDVDGTIDVIRKKIKLSAKGQKFPIQSIFENFRNPHLRKIYGLTDVEGTFEGWGKKFIATAKGVTFEGGFKPIVGERIETDMTVTYNKLEFAWKLYQGARHTGTADLTVNMGPKVEGAPRHKSIDLVAKLTGHQLEPSFPGFRLTGTADGEIDIKGPIKGFKGSAKAKVIEGSWLNVPIDSVVAKLDLSRYKIIFNDVELKPKTLKKMPFINPLVMNLIDGRFNLTGEPIAGLNIDLHYIYEPKRTQIDRISYQPPQRPGEQMELRGSIVSGGSVNLTASGKFDLSALDPLSVLIREASGPATLSLRAGGTTSSPTLFGTIELGGNSISPRPVRLAMENLTGTLRFEGRRIYFDGITGQVEDGQFALGGWIEHSEFKLARANLTLNGKEFSFRTAENTFRMEFDGKLTLTGAFPNPLLAGDINILDGRYTKDFVLLEQLGGKARQRDVGEGEQAITFNPRLNLDVRNSGDLLIRNNVGDIDLRADITIRGTREKPQIEGAVAVREGRINYLGLKFEITRGFVEFRGPYAKPYLEVEAERELRLYNISLRLFGYTDNLALDLTGTSPSGPLEKRDVVSLLAFGITEQERRETEAARTGSQIGISVAAQQVGQMLERPITEATKLDIFRIEAAEEETDYDEPGKIATRLRVGKQLTDRLSVDFATDIDTRDAEQTVTTEYLITDNLLIKGSRSSDSKYEGNIGLRFRLR